MHLILSSGFLAFARHVGVLEALEVEGIEVDVVVGTSSGALIAALWSSGVSLAEIARLFSDVPPLSWFGVGGAPWRGVFSLRRVRAELSRRLPADFAELSRPLHVGVRDSSGAHRLLCEGPLVDAVIASFAVPRLFPPVTIGGDSFSDGGAVDRTAVEPWRRMQRGRRVVVHEVASRFGRPAAQPAPDELWIRTPRSAATLLGTGPFHFEKEQARTVALAVLRGR